MKPKFFAISALKATHKSLVNDDQILKEIKEALLSDDVTKDYKSLLKSGPREFKKSLQDWNYENGLLLYRGKVYIPKSKDEELRRRIVQMHHDLPSAGHPGRWKTYELVSRNYWWPGMTIDVKKYVMGCDICQRNKSSHTPPYGLLQPNLVPTMPWEVITIDLITQLPASADLSGNPKTAIVVIVDRFTKRALFFGLQDSCTTLEVAQILYEHVFKDHGLPRQIISDCGTQFASKVFQEFCKILGIKSTMSTAYHPQTDGQTERVNQSLEQYLRIFCNHRQDDWVKLLSSAEFAYNNAAHESTGLSPFFIEYGYHPRMAPKPGPIQVDGQDEFEVEAILDSRVHRGWVQDMVKWKGYGAGDSSWEDAAALAHAQAKVRAFHKANPSAPRKIAATSFADLCMYLRPIHEYTEKPDVEQFPEVMDLEWETGKYFGPNVRPDSSVV